MNHYEVVHIDNIVFGVLCQKLCQWLGGSLSRSCNIPSFVRTLM